MTLLLLAVLVVYAFHWRLHRFMNNLLSIPVELRRRRLGVQNGTSSVHSESSPTVCSVTSSHISGNTPAFCKHDQILARMDRVRVVDLRTFLRFFRSAGATTSSIGVAVSEIRWIGEAASACNRDRFLLEIWDCVMKLKISSSASINRRSSFGIRAHCLHTCTRCPFPENCSFGRSRPRILQ
jgi:hypothetical protein